MADGGAVGYAGDMVTGGISLVRRGIGWLLDENDVGRDRQNRAAGPQDRPPEAMEPGPLAGPDAEPEYAHRVNGAAAAAAAVAAAGAADATAQAAERARMATRSRYAFVIFMSLSFLAGFSIGMCWCTAAARPVSSGDSGSTPPAADAPKFRVTFNVEGHTAEDIKFRLNMVKDPVKPPPSPEWPVWGALRSASTYVLSVPERAMRPPRLAYSIVRGMVARYGDDTSSTGGDSSGGGGSDSSSGGDSVWSGWDFLLRSVLDQAAVTAQQAYDFFDWMTISNGDDDATRSSSSSGGNSNNRSGGGSSGSDKERSPGTHTDGGKWTNPLKKFNSWRTKHRDAAEEFMDGPLV